MNFATNSTPKRMAIDPACQEDPFYRYQMRQLLLNVVGKGNMIRTFVTNIDDVAQDLKIPPRFLITYLGQKIGAQSLYDGEKQKQQRAFLSGNQSVESISEIVERFILDFILCYQCSLPELLLKKSSTAFVVCQSCGWKKKVADMKLPAKFVKFVDANAPKTEKKVKKEIVIVRDEKVGEDDGDWSDFSQQAIEKRASEMLPTSTLKQVFQ